MHRAKFILALFVLVGLMGCGPAVVVHNDTGFAVRAIVTHSEGSEVLSPSPGESSTADIAEGAYTVSAIPDQEWVDYAKLTRQALNDQLAHPENLSGPQLLDVIQRLKAIAAKMDAFKSAAGSAASCSGSVSSDSAGEVSVSTGADGALVVTCR